MKDYLKLKNQLEELRIDILNYTNNDVEPQDLMDYFFKVKQKDPETYELLVLIYNEFQTTHKLNKKQFQAMIDKSFAIKDGTVNKLILERPNHLKLTTRVYNAITWKNIFRIFLLWSSVILVLTMLYKFAPDAFQELSTNTFKIIDKVEKVIK